MNKMYITQIKYENMKKDIKVSKFAFEKVHIGSKKNEYT